MIWPAKPRVLLRLAIEAWRKTNEPPRIAKACGRQHIIREHYWRAGETIRIRATLARIAAGVLAGLLLLPGQASATELKPEAIRGFNNYVQHAEHRMQGELQGGSAFLHVDSLPDSERRAAQGQLERGEVVTEDLEGQDDADDTRTPGAKIHDWLGTVFIPGATLKQVLTLAQDYDEHQMYFQPQVMKSKLVSRTGDDFTIYMRLKQTKIITVVFDTDHEVHYVHLDAARAYSISRTTRVVEVTHPGEADERALPEGNDHGFLWRLNSYWRFLETPRGVTVQCEAISLSRDIPFGLHFLIGQFVEGIARDSLEFTLQTTRTDALGEHFRVNR